jgi:hypothetical protein
VPVKARVLSLRLLAGALLSASAASADGPANEATKQPTKQPTKQECVSANESAQDLQRAGKLREARARLLVCVTEGCPGPVREDCAQRIEELDRVMPSLVFEVRDESDRDLSAVRITMDGQVLADKLDGTAIPVDLGEHRFEFAAPGLAPDTRTLVVREGDKKRRERIVLVAAPVAPPAPSTSAARLGASESPAERPSGDGSTQRTIGVALGGAGVVGLVVGSAFGLVSKSTYGGALTSQCGPPRFATETTCSATGVKDVNSANTQATVSTVGFIASAVLLGGGALLYFTAPRAARVTVGPTVGAGTAGVTLRATW